MQRVKALGVALVAMLALSGVAVSSASASLFLAHPTGKITGRGTNTHVFTTNGGKVECETVAVSGTAPVLKSLHHSVNVKYTNCSAFGFIGAEISEAKYLFSADLKVSVSNTITITVKAFPVCSVTVTPTGNQNLDGVHYANKGSDIKVDALARKITYTTTGGFCGEGGSNGVYVGEAIVAQESGGVLRWCKDA